MSDSVGAAFDKAFDEESEKQATDGDDTVTAKASKATNVKAAPTTAEDEVEEPEPVAEAEAVDEAASQDDEEEDNPLQLTKEDFQEIKSNPKLRAIMKNMNR